jgi:exodeoxyribonuclease V alpha subunit
MSPAQAEWITLCGQVQHVTYHDSQSGFTIAQVRIEGQSTCITAAGDLMGPVPGTILNMQGRWNDHPRYGRQFRVAQFESRLPTDEASVRKYLGSGLIKGIGPIMAGRIIDCFGPQAFEIMSQNIVRLLEVPGIGPKRLGMIDESWQAQTEMRTVMLFLHGHGIGPAHAAKILKRYGHQTIVRVQENPYQLANDIEGIGFLTADRLAGRLGFDRASPLRIAAGMLHVLREQTEEGHVYSPYQELIDRALPLLQTNRPAAIKAIDDLTQAQKIVIETFGQEGADASPAHVAVYPAPFHRCEIRVAQRLQMLMQTPPLWPTEKTDSALEWVQQTLDLTLADRQADAVRLALRHKVLVITGGPGTGKTTIVRAITQLYARRRAAIMLAAPTGRAAKRLGQATGLAAKTIHRLLEYSPAQGDFQRNTSRPLETDLLIVDEASMIDILLMDHLLRAIPAQASVILVGDVDQLPSVGPGQTLKDIINSNCIPTVVLDRIFRQASGSGIVVNAHRINNGRMPLPAGPDDRPGEFYFIEQDSVDKIAQTIITLACERIPRRFGHDPIDDIQILTPMHRGTVGAQNLNRRLQDALNPQDVYVTHGDQQLRLYDKVMQVRNNYDKDVFNGDLGRIRHIDSQARTLTVRFDERDLNYDFGELNDLVLAYAVSVHKAQGSEYPAVIVPVALQHYVLLQRNLIYTAITRARNLTVLVGSKKALAIAIHNKDARLRHTRLADRLREAAEVHTI